MKKSPEALLEIARQKTRRLSSHERRAVIAHLDETDPAHYSNLRLAELFGVDEKMIRKDKKSLLHEYTSTITPEYAMSFVGAYLKSHDDLIRKARHGLDKCAPGTQGHERYVRLLSDLENKRMTILQEIGAVPKELGNLNVTEERWVATVSDDGVVEVLPGQGVSGLLTDGQTIQ